MAYFLKVIYISPYQPQLHFFKFSLTFYNQLLNICLIEESFLRKWDY